MVKNYKYDRCGFMAYLRNNRYFIFNYFFKRNNCFHTILQNISNFENQNILNLMPVKLKADVAQG